jgi:hypothetical protein
MHLFSVSLKGQAAIIAGARLLLAGCPGALFFSFSKQVLTHMHTGDRVETINSHA